MAEADDAVGLGPLFVDRMGRRYEQSDNDLVRPAVPDGAQLHLHCGANGRPSSTPMAVGACEGAKVDS